MSTRRSSSPDTPVPFWEWHWADSSLTTRIYLAYRVVVRPVLAVAAIIGAALVIVDAYPRARDTLDWRGVEYRKLAALHAGYDASYAERLFGAPTQSRALAGTDYSEDIYVRRDHYVQLVEDGAGRIVLMSVTSCSPDFRPRFTISRDSSVTLQTRPLQDSTRASASNQLSGEERDLGYEPGGTGSSPTMYWESTGQGSTASRGRTWFFGVNPLCLTPAQYREIPGEEYFGPSEEAPQEALAFRRKYAANTYAEVVDLTPAMSDLGMLYLPPSDGGLDTDCADLDAAGDYRCGRVTVGTFWYDLAVPPSGSTRTFH